MKKIGRRIAIAVLLLGSLFPGAISAYAQSLPEQPPLESIPCEETGAAEAAALPQETRFTSPALIGLCFPHTPAARLSLRTRQAYERAAARKESVLELSLTYHRGDYVPWDRPDVPCRFTYVPDCCQEAFSAYRELGVAELEDGYLNIRYNPNGSSLIIGYLPAGAACEILGSTVNTQGTADPSDDQEWLQIRSGRISSGYVRADYICRGVDAIAAAMPHIERSVRITVDAANVRSAPDTAGDNRLFVAYQSAGFALEAEEEEWFRVGSDMGPAYISKQCAERAYRLLSAEAIAYSITDTTREDMVRYAKQFVGNPYVWGNESLTNGCDCSGFVIALYRKFAGIELIHYSASQALRGREISASELKPGDLVFYDSMNKGSITHVAVYIGDGQVIQALNERVGICITRYDFIKPLKYVNILDYPNECRY